MPRLISPARLAQQPDGGRFVALDSLRGVAALMVAASHVPSAGPLFGLAPIRNAPFLVDFFFVLSGFVIAAAYGERLRSGFSLAQYAVLRLGRLFPLHIAILSLWLAMALAAPLVAPGHTVFGGDRSFGQFVLTVLLLQAFDNDSSLAWNGPSWSISVEIWLYFAFAVLWRLSGRGWAWLVPTAAVTLAMLGLLGAHFQGFGTPFSAYMARGLAGFGLGTLCQWGWASGLDDFTARRGDLFVSASQALAAVLVVALLNVSSAGYVLSDLTFALLVLVVVSDRGWLARLLSTKPMLVLGTLSYSIYLVHRLPIEVVLQLLRPHGMTRIVDLGQGPIALFVLPTPVSELIGVALMLVTLAGAYLTWRFVEFPAREWSRRKAARMGVAAEERVAPSM